MGERDDEERRGTEPVPLRPGSGSSVVLASRSPNAPAGGLASDIGPLRLGLSTGALFPVPTEAVPAMAARRGLVDLEVMLQTAGEYAPAFARDLAARCRDQGCRVHAVHVWQEFHPLLSPYARRAEEAAALFDLAIEGAARLGARVLVWHGPKRTEAANPGGWDRFLEVAAARAAACETAGLALGIENVSWCALATTREVAAFAARLDELDPGRTGRIGFVFDPFQAAEAGQNPFMTLAAMGDRVLDVHLSDIKEADPTGRHLPPGEGDLPWPALVRAVAGVYQGPMMLEGVVGELTGRLERSRALLDPILAEVARAGDEADPCAGAPPAGVLEGIRLFNEREFYECHETIEHEWHAERRSVRRLYQGILQIGVGFLHALRGNHRGALLLLGDGIAKTAEFAPSCRGIEAGRLAVEAQACLDRLRDLGPERLASFDQEMIPRIHVSPVGGAAPRG
ncbi:MAG TPA: DUF309 domain-containing protein [Thermomicrobiales bacterium]|nr:DUF309 domain-containing protein [Thermomicrobiales bacterium]